LNNWREYSEVEGLIGPPEVPRSKRSHYSKADGVFNPILLEELLLSMLKHKDGWPFDRPVTDDFQPGYSRVIDRPIDLLTIRSNINRLKYSRDQDVLDDIRQVFVNWFTFKKPKDEVYKCAVRLEKFFLEESKKWGLDTVQWMPRPGLLI
jgi:hypothetical protein